MQANAAFQATNVAARIPVPAGTKSLFLQNNGPNPCYLGATATDANATAGLILAAGGGELAIDVLSHDVYVVCPVANQVSPADIRWWANGY